MPIVHVRALPSHEPVDVRTVIEGLGEDIAAATSIPLDRISIAWTWLQPGHYVTGGVAGATLDELQHPVLVDVQIPDLHPQERIERLLLATAESLARRVGVARENVRATATTVRSGQVLSQGRIERW